MSKLFYIPGILLRSISLCFTLCFTGSAALSPDPMTIGATQQDNRRPVVRFTTPKNGETYTLHSRVPYSLNISDPEDGESKYEEIPRNRVLLRVQYVSGDAPPSASGRTISEDPAGLVGILGSNCLNCHAFKSKLIGPSFHEISKKYQAGEPDMDLMASRIKNGSSGVWGSVVMPGHPELSDREIEEMLLWIMKDASLDLMDYYTGTEGSFLLNPPAGSDKKGTIVLTASYTDQGIAGQQRLKGEDRITLRVANE